MFDKSYSIVEAGYLFRLWKTILYLFWNFVKYKFNPMQIRTYNVNTTKQLNYLRVQILQWKFLCFMSVQTGFSFSKLLHLCICKIQWSDYSIPLQEVYYKPVLTQKEVHNDVLNRMYFFFFFFVKLNASLMQDCSLAQLSYGVTRQCMWHDFHQVDCNTTKNESRLTYCYPHVRPFVMFW